MHVFPPSILEAFEMVGQERSEFLYGYEAKWGGFDLPALERALEGSEREERLFTLLALGCGMYTSAIPRVIPFLQSNYPLERWVAAFSLGIMREEIALSALVAQVTEFLPHPQYYSVEEPFESHPTIEWRYDEWRSTTIRILGEWERLELTDAYLQMSKVFWYHEQEKNDQIPPPVRKRQQYLWKYCLKELLYALGRLERFEEVETLGREMNIPDSILSLWKVYCAFGFLRIRTRYPDIFMNMKRKWNDQVLQRQVIDVLKHHFSLSEGEAQFCLDRYQEDINTFFEVRGWNLDGDENEEMHSEVDDTFGGFYSPF